MGNCLGIDPGKTGAIAYIEDGFLKWAETCPVFKNGNKSQYDERRMAKIILDNHIDKAVIENVHAFPGQGSVSMFNFGYGFGIWIGIFATTTIPYTLVSPQRWKKDMVSGVNAEKKMKSVVQVKRLYPDLAITTKEDHNICDAILIARWGLEYGI